MNRLFYWLHKRSREKKRRLFFEYMRPNAGARILNVGATGSSTGLEIQFEASYRWPERITGGGPNLDELRDYRRSFPSVSAIAFDGCALPFRDRSFDIVYSNAVIEHLIPEQQQKFAGEVQRVGKAWFVTTPNRWFMVEPHYHLPLVQFLSQERQKAVASRLGKVPYDQLELLGRRQLHELFPTSEIVGCRVTLYAETLIALRAPS
jgi:hypothetical protein